MTEYGDAALRRETEHPQDKITYDAEFAELGRKLDKLLEILTATIEIARTADQGF